VLFLNSRGAATGFSFGLALSQTIELRLRSCLGLLF
jgi:hypothetical protein